MAGVLVVRLVGKMAYMTVVWMAVMKGRPAVAQKAAQKAAEKVETMVVN